MRGPAVVLLATVAAASAQPKSRDKAEADQLFYEGRQLLAQDKRDEACAKFDLSFRKDPRAIGTILNLGLCGEMTGKVATAIRYYAEARDRARDQELREYQDAAERKIALLSPRVPHLDIQLAESLPDMRVLVDTAVLAPHQLAGLEVDPGKRTIVVTARGRLPYETSVEIAEGERKTISIPKLEGARTVYVERPGSTRRTLGKLGVFGGAGLVATGVVLGILGDRAYWDEFPDGARDGVATGPVITHDCWNELAAGEVVRQCNAQGVKQLRSARRLAHVGTGVGILGGVAIAAGVYLWLTAPSDTTVTPTVSAEGAGVAISGRF